MANCIVSCFPFCRSNGVTRLENLIKQLKSVSCEQRFINRLASSYGNLSEYLQTIDDEMKIAIASTISVTHGKCYELSYGELLADLSRNSALKKVRDPVKRTNTYESSGFNVSLWSSEDEHEIRWDQNDFFTRIKRESEGRLEKHFNVVLETENYNNIYMVPKCRCNIRILISHFKVIIYENDLFMLLMVNLSANYFILNFKVFVFKWIIFFVGKSTCSYHTLTE